MPSVLHLDPVLRAARLIEPVTVFAHQAFQPHLADGAEQVGPDLALFERSHEDTVRVPRQQTRKVRLPHRERQSAQVIANVR
jgi:hypothetical protein